MRRGLRGLVAAVAGLALVAGAHSGTPHPASVQTDHAALAEAYAAADASGHDTDIARLLSLLPREDGRYVFQGDLFYTAVEVAKAIRDRREARKRQIRPLLVIRLRDDNRPDFWETSEARRLTYSIDRGSFGANADNVSRLMGHATADWSDACADCGITFTLNQQLTNKPGPVTFVVRQKNSAFAIASAFFPSWDSADRYLNVGERAFSAGVDTQGVLRHELGHVLGYEHENYQNPAAVPACRLIKARWEPLTSYDPQSVMHHFCGENDAKRFAITEIDRAGHRVLYGSARR